jgi:proline iminopeptidase
MNGAFVFVVASILLSTWTGSATALGTEICSGVIPVRGAQVHYIIEGNGVPCLVIGHAESSRLLCSLELKKHFQFVFMDLRHDARSESSLERSEITLDTYLEDIDAVSRALGLGNFIIWGHSHHAYIALKYAQKYPSKVSGIIMTACTPCDTGRSRRDEFWETDASDERKALFAQTWGEFQEQRPKMTREERRVPQLVAMAPKLLYDPKDTLSLRKVGEKLVNRMYVYLHYQLEILKDYDLAEESEQVAAPVFLVLGRYDYIAPYALWNDERKFALPNLSYHLFPKSGHFPQIEESELFDRKLIEWIRDQ